MSPCKGRWRLFFFAQKTNFFFNDGRTFEIMLVLVSFFILFFCTCGRALEGRNVCFTQLSLSLSLSLAHARALSLSHTHLNLFLVPVRQALEERNVCFTQLSLSLSLSLARSLCLSRIRI